MTGAWRCLSSAVSVSVDNVRFPPRLDCARRQIGETQALASRRPVDRVPPQENDLPLGNRHPESLWFRRVCSHRLSRSLQFVSQYTSNADGELDRTIAKSLLVDGMTMLPGFELCPLNRVALEQAVKLFLFTPTAVEIVEGDLARFDVANNRISPVSQLHGVSGCARTKELNFLVSRRRKLHPPSRRTECFDITDFRLDVYNVRQ